LSGSPCYTLRLPISSLIEAAGVPSITGNNYRYQWIYEQSTGPYNSFIQVIGRNITFIQRKPEVTHGYPTLGVQCSLAPRKNAVWRTKMESGYFSTIITGLNRYRFISKCSPIERLLSQHGPSAPGVGEARHYGFEEWKLSLPLVRLPEHIDLRSIIHLGILHQTPLPSHPIYLQSHMVVPTRASHFVHQIL
jgi:hypothetical protein